MSRRRRASTAAGVALAVVATLLLPAVALAHPLGNFTINHYAGIRVTPTDVRVDLVIDLAEIPTFELRGRLDANADGEVTDAELAGAGDARCAELASDVRLAVDGRPLDVAVLGAAMAFPPGLGGIPTTRIECDLAAQLPTPATGNTLTFADGSYAERVGWREIVASGEGVVVEGDALPATISARLAAYPEDLLSTPPDMRSVTLAIVPGGAAPRAVTGAPGTPGDAAPTAVLGASVPGGIGEEVAGLLAVRDLSPVALLGTLLVAAALGAAHALSPGHGKTVMAAYLVGSRGTARHALALGGLVTASHTAGVLLLALGVLSATAIVPPERLVPALAIVSGVLFTAIGTWMLRDQLRARRRRRPPAAPSHDHDHSHDRGGHAHPHGDHAHELGGHAHELGGHAHEHGEHAHGPFRHSHLPAEADAVVTWRRLLVLGLAGGLVPSVSALILLLGSLAAGRPAYGLVLVIAFGAGMAAVLGGIGLALVHARGLLERRASFGRLAALLANLPLVAALVVIAAGLWVTASSAFGVAL